MDAINPNNTLRLPAPSGQSEPAPAPAESGKELPSSGNAQPVDMEPIDLSGAVQQIESYLSSSQRALSFRVDESSGRPVMTVTNPETGEVIRQVPGDEVLKMAAKISSGGTRLLDTLA
jgi:flagellar protein FlaG